MREEGAASVKTGDTIAVKAERGWMVVDVIYDETLDCLCTRDHVGGITRLDRWKDIKVLERRVNDNKKDGLVYM